MIFYKKMMKSLYVTSQYTGVTYSFQVDVKETSGLTN